MAGDHKCPVCQATFTRPQHVARHMRSHTGDRPYKCTHCGDQFARSDLLSRHVNKCHAGDKPPTTTAPTRRKGAASSTRATTSKQACDQCVIATLPCDGANPCSKCIQRKNPCTYVKFQRQTAPSGPGHRHSHSVDSTSSTSSLVGSVPRPDELFLGPPPVTVPSMGSGAGELFYPQFAFNAPSGAPTWDSDSPNLPSLSLSGTDSGADSSSSDRFRNTDMMRSSSLPQVGYAQGMGCSGFTANSNAYYSLQQQQPVQPTDAWQFSTDFKLPLQRKMDEGFAQYLPPGNSAHLGGTSSMLNPTDLDFNNGTAGGGGLYSLQTRRDSIDGFSDGSGLSAPNSAASSSVHLPVDFGSAEQGQRGQQIQPLSMLYQFDENQQAPPSREGRVASSFGLMTLADGDQPFITNFSNGNNGVNVDGTAPFFSQHAMKLPPQDSTPRPFRNDDRGAGPAASTPRDREAEMRELRDFWKQYLRTPLTGSFGATPKAELLNNQLGSYADGSRPTSKRGLSRVASLPSVRTPPDETMAPIPSRVTNSHSQSHAQLPLVQTSDDLKSYEQAVLARKPLNLTFVPRKGRHSVSSSASPQPLPEQQLHMQPPSTNGGPGVVSSTYAPGPLVALVSTDGGNSSDDNPVSGDVPSQRPSFKRLASQTLENATQKRTMFRWGESEDAVDDSESDVDGPSDAGSPPMRFDAAMRTSSMNPTSYHRGMQYAHSGVGAAAGTEALIDRYRRQSAPTGVRPNVAGVEMTNGKMDESSPSPVLYVSSPMGASHTIKSSQLIAPGIDGNSLVQT